MRARFDPVDVVVQGIAQKDETLHIGVGVGADYDGGHVEHVVQVPMWSPVGGPWNRWLFDVQVVVTSFGPVWSDTIEEHEKVGNAVLSLTDVGGVLVSSVRCVAEPVRFAAHAPSGAEMVSSTYQMMMRREQNV